jgi:hypothetical protein
MESVRWLTNTSPDASDWLRTAVFGVSGVSPILARERLLLFPTKKG